MTEMIAQGRARPMLRRPHGRAFSTRKQQRFLDALALTCNVSHAAAHAGVDRACAYRLRIRDAAFAARWQEAVASACDRLEMLVLEHSGAGVALEPGDGERAAGEGAGEPFDFHRALATLKLFRSQREGQAMASACNPRRVATREELAAALTRALAAVKRGMAAEGGEAKRDDEKRHGDA